MPPPLTVPLPLTVTVNVVAAALEKLAVTALSAFIVIVHVVAIPVQLAPFQPMNVDPAAGVAVSVIDWSAGSVAVHGERPLPQLITPGPVLPATTTVSCAVAVELENVALTFRSLVICTVHDLPLPPLAQSPPQELKK